MPSLKRIKIKFVFVLLGVVGAWIGCSDSPPIAPRPAGKATCALCDFLGDERYTIADGQSIPESPDTTQTEAEADSTQTEADSTQSAAVSFADANLERAVREALNRPQGTLTVADLDTLTVLDASDRNIQSLVGLEHATALRELYLRLNEITDVQPLASLTNLQSLSLSGNEIVDIQPLASLTKLRKLSLWGNAITDVQPLASLTKLQWLQLENNDIADVRPLASLTNLYWLGVLDNALSEHAVNQQLAALLEKGVRIEAGIDRIHIEVEEREEEAEVEVRLFTGFTDANLESAVRTALSLPQGPLTAADLASLTSLSAGGINIVRLDGLEYATALHTLHLHDNAIRDVSPLASLTNLQRLWLYNNQIADVRPLASLTNLGRLWMEDNNVEDLSPLVGLPLTWLQVENNPLSSASINTHIPAIIANGAPGATVDF